MLHLGSIVTSSQPLSLSELFIMLDVGGRGGQGHGGTPCPSLPGPPAASLRLAREPCDADGPSRPAWPEWTAAARPLQPWARRGGAVSGVRGAPSDHLQRRPSSPGASLASRGACRPRPPHCPWDAGAAPRCPAPHAAARSLLFVARVRLEGTAQEDGACFPRRSPGEQGRCRSRGGPAARWPVPLIPVRGLSSRRAGLNPRVRSPRVQGTPRGSRGPWRWQGWRSAPGELAAGRGARGARRTWPGLPAGGGSPGAPALCPRHLRPPVGRAGPQRQAVTRVCPPSPRADTRLAVAGHRPSWAPSAEGSGRDAAASKQLL